MYRYARMKTDDTVESVYEQNHPLDMSAVKKIGGRLAIRPVEVIGRINDYDKELYNLIGPVFEVEPAKVTERYSLEPKANFEATLHIRLDEKADRKREKYLHDYSAGGAVVAMMRGDEARRFLAAEDPDPKMFPFVEKGIDVFGATYEDVAKEYVNMDNRVRLAFASIERTRMVTHGAIESAETHEEKMAILESVRFSTDHVGRQSAEKLG